MRFRRATAALLWLCAVNAFPAGEQDAFSVGIFYQGVDGYYAREDKDREWHIRVTAPVKPACGIYLLVHDAGGKILLQQAIPEGSYSPAEPFTVTIPADGKTGDCKIIVLGSQMDFQSVLLPLTDLPFEVYGGRCFIFFDNLNPEPCFQVAPGVTNIVLLPQGNARVLKRDGTVVAELARKNRLDTKGRRVMDVVVSANTTYILEPASRYLKCDPPLFLARSPELWFFPDPALDKVKWWENAVK